MTFVGIDLGTTYSLVAHLDASGKPIIIPNDQGKLLTPSVVDLRSSPPLVGDAAKERQALGDEGIYSFFKRNMGKSGALYIENERQYTPIDLSAFVLNYLKRCAEQYLQQSVTDAVITVPAYFTDPQRIDTIRAGQQAGLNVLRIMNEPTAAAIAFGLRPSQTSARYLIYDLGGGTFDVTLVELSPSELRVLATDGDHQLGGKDWDDRLLQYLSGEFEREFGIELIGDSINDLLVLAEETKRTLSEKTSTTVTVQGAGKLGRYTVSREIFEDLTRDLLARTENLVKTVLHEKKLTLREIEGVILVGGATRMPSVREYVERMSGKSPLSGVHPDEAVALGAAVQAAMDMEATGKTTSLMQLGRRLPVPIDVTSHSMGMIAENESGDKYINSIILPKNREIPCVLTRPYQFRVKRGGENRLEVFMTQGELEDPTKCVYLGKYVFSGLPSSLTGVIVIDISYKYNTNGVVELSAKERSSGTALKLTIEPLPLDVPYRFTLPPENSAQREHLSIYMVFDVSGSMQGEPLRRAQEAALSFVKECDLSTTSIGVIEFSDEVHTIQTAVQDARQIENTIKALEVGATGLGTSGHPFDQVYEHLHRQKQGHRFTIILTDGIWDDQRLAEQRAKRCHGAKIDVVAIGFGKADEAFLKRISSHEDFGILTDLNRLADTFSTIARELTDSGGHLMPRAARNLKLHFG